MEYSDLEKIIKEIHTLPEVEPVELYKFAEKIPDEVQLTVFKDSSDSAVMKFPQWVHICKSETEKRLVYGVVIEPETDVTEDGDLHGDRMTEEEIEKSCHGYMLTSQEIHKQHEGEMINAAVVENYMAPIEMVLDEETTIKKGSWVQVTKVFDDVTWEAVEKGELTCYSPGGEAQRISD